MQTNQQNKQMEIQRQLVTKQKITIKFSLHTKTKPEMTFIFINYLLFIVNF